MSVFSLSLFPVFHLTSAAQWSVEQHLVPYLRGEALPDDSLATRMSLFKRYMSTTNLVADWLAFLPAEEQEIYRPFLFPTLTPFWAQTLFPLEKEVKRQRQDHRKQETEAVVPEFTALRTEAHFRLRFLMHGMMFQTSSGEPVILKAHLLRHAFATFAVQIEGLPLDLVAEWLKQKNLDTTRYYSQKGQRQVAEEHASFVERLATEIHIREAIVRSPEDIRKLAEAAQQRVGTLVPVCGGDCTFDGWCHNQFDCIRCPSKVPEPEKRSQVEEKQRWAEQRLAYYEREGLVLEAQKMRQLLRNCALELREMDMMVAYRKDEGHAAQVKFYPRSPRNIKE